MTYREVVSRIQNHLNTLDKDMFIPRRFILSVVKSKGEFLIAQRFNDKSIFRETNLYDWIRCVELEEVDTIKCGRVELEKCSTAMVSKKKLPKLIWSRYGSSILMVTNAVDEKEYTLITPSQYVKMRKSRNFEKFSGKFAIVYPDGKIAIPDSTVRLINVLMFSLDEKKKDFKGCDDDSGECDSYWDTEFNIPDKIREVAIQEALKDISMRVQIPKDENPQGDSNIKSREQN
jgi:hypothetical protein